MTTMFDIYGEKIAEMHRNNHKSRLARHAYNLEQMEREDKKDESLRNRQSNT